MTAITENILLINHYLQSFCMMPAKPQNVNLIAVSKNVLPTINKRVG